MSTSILCGRGLSVKLLSTDLSTRKIHPLIYFKQIPEEGDVLMEYCFLG